MKRCESHYPILGRWDKIEDTSDYATYRCPDCGETTTYYYHKGALEFMPDRIKEDRDKHAMDTIQPYRGDVLSKEYIAVHGTKNIPKDKVKSAKWCWQEIPAYRKLKT